MVYAPFAFVPGHQRRHGFVDFRRAQAAAERQDAQSLPHAQHLPGQHTVGVQDALPHGIAGNPVVDAFGEMFFGAFHRQQHPVRLTSQKPGGNAGIGVLLMGQRFIPQFVRRAQHRAADVASGTHHQVGLKLREDLTGPAPASRQKPNGVHIARQIAGRNAALKALDPDRREPVTRLGHQPSLHPPGIARKQYFGVGHAFFQRVRHGQRGIDVARRAAAGKQNLHRLDFLRLNGFYTLFFFQRGLP